jgi:ribosomal protein S7
MRLYKSRESIVEIFANSTLRSGRKWSSHKFFFDVLKILKQKGVRAPLLFILERLHELRPMLGTRVKHVAGAKLKIPARLPIRQQYLKSVRWILEGAKKRVKSSLQPEDVVAELMENYKNRYTYSRKLQQEFNRTVKESRAHMRFLQPRQQNSTPRPVRTQFYE